MIPDVWFVKKSTLSGQETFFPKEKILERINAILEMKETHSFEEMSDLFSPDVQKQTYQLENIIAEATLSIKHVGAFMQYTERTSCSFFELLCIYISSKEEFAKYFSEEKNLESFYRSVVNWQKQVKNTLLELYMGDTGGNIIYVLASVDNQIFFDNNMQMIERISLDEYAKSLQLYLKD